MISKGHYLLSSSKAWQTQCIPFLSILVLEKILHTWKL